MASITATTAAASRSRQALSVRVVSRLAFTVCFMVWTTFEVRPRRVPGPEAA